MKWVQFVRQCRYTYIVRELDYDMNIKKFMRGWSKRKKIIAYVISGHIVYILYISLLLLIIFLVDRPEPRKDGHIIVTLSSSISSPDGLHSLMIYTNEGASPKSTADATNVFITANNSGERWDRKETWCLFSSLRDNDIHAGWIDNETVEIYSGNESLKKYCLIMNIYQDEINDY